jgi:hypothetical protein
MSDVAAVPPSNLEIDVPCTRCGYNLRGLGPEGNCPECGAAVAVSIGGQLLRFADPAWLNRLKLGTSLKLWNIVFMILGGFVGGVLAAGGGPPAALGLLGLIGQAIGVTASFAITTQEPRIALQEDPVTLRKVIRVCAIATFVGGGLELMSDYILTSIVFLVLTALLQLTGIVSGFGELVYFRRFAIRIPNEKLASSTKRFTWFAVVTAVLVGGGALGIAVLAPNVAAGGGGGTGGNPGTFLLAFGMCFGALLAVTAFIWYLALLMKYRRAFTFALAESSAGRDLVKGDVASGA